MALINRIVIAALLLLDTGCTNNSLTKSAVTTPGGGIILRQGSTEIANGGTFAIPDTKKYFSVPLSFVIENTGTSAVTLTGTPLVSLTEQGSSDFSVTSYPSLAIDGGSRSAFTLNFLPSGEATRTAEIAIESSEGTYSFTISGTGIPNSLTENRAVYSGDTLDVLEIHLLVGTGQESAFKALIDWTCSGSTVPTYPECLAWSPPPVNVTFREVQPGTGTVLFEQEGTLRLRGGSTRDAWGNQKSWKVELKSAVNLWRGQDNLNFNKHTYDLTRMRNKLSFDIFKEIPDFTSLRTQFVNIKINVDVSGVSQATPASYGLFTFIENGDKKFLKSHGLDDSGNLYKTKDFAFSSNGVDGDLEKLQAAISANNTADFEKILESKGNSDHTKLLNLIRDVNDMNIDIDDVVETNFNRDNYLTWLAINMLTMNVDTQNQNFYLYCPGNSKIWYFLPWDYDGAWGWYYQPDQAEVNNYSYILKTMYGPPNYWNITLHSRFLGKSQNVTDLLAKIDEIKNSYLTQANITAKVENYKPVIVNTYLLSSPDCDGLPLTTTSRSSYTCNSYSDLTELNSEIENLKTIVNKTYSIALNEFQSPMPVWLGEYNNGVNIVFSWDPSYDLQGNTLYYDFQLFTNMFTVTRDGNGNPQMGTPGSGSVDIQNNLTVTDYEHAGQLPAGRYYWRVIIKDSSGNWQIPFSQFRDSAGLISYGGMNCIDVDGNGIATRCP